jgi:glutamate-1-semialdehyde 2,1-aminomutase
MTQTLSFRRSAAYNQEAAQLIPGAVNSNVRLAGSPIPLCFEKGEGAHIFDIDGNRFIDYALGMGPAVLGHAPRQVNDAVAASLARGQLYAGQHRHELELARLMNRYIPSAEMIRVCMSGSEAVQAAIRLARAATGRSKLIKFEGQYHGWFDNVLISHSPAAGEDLPVPRAPHLETRGQASNSADDLIVLPWNDVTAIDAVVAEHGADIAAIISEPAMLNTGAIPPRRGYLEHLRAVTRDHGIVLIFDEVITGFRLGLGGAQQRFGVTPDLSTFAKAMAGGFPVAALVGRRNLMELFGAGKVNHSGTYNSNVISIVAAIETIRCLGAENGAALERAESTGNAIIDGLRRLAREKGSRLQVSGYGAAFCTWFGEPDSVVDYQSYKRTDLSLQQAFLTELVQLGIRPTSRGTWFVSAAHDSNDVHTTLDAAALALARLL